MRSRHSSMPEPVADQDGIHEPRTRYERDRVQPQRSCVRCGGTPRLRDKEDTLPRRISSMWNVETPLRSGTGGQAVHPCQSATRKDGPTPQRDRKAQEANASRRKAEGIHNLLDRAAQAERPTRKGADVGLVNHRKNVTKRANRRTS